VSSGRSPGQRRVTDAIAEDAKTGAVEHRARLTAA